MLELLTSLLLFSLVFTGFFITYFNVNNSFMQSIEALNNHRQALQILLNLSGIELSGQSNSLVQEPLLNNQGFRVEVVDLEDNITWFYGEVNQSFIVGLPLIVNDHLGRGVVYCGLSFQ